jgi:hypothetical protein
MALLRGAASRAIFACALLLPSIHAAAEPQNGWWWNPNESGRGYFIEVSGGVFYLAGYFYESDGRATWLSAGGAVTDLYSLTGTLLLSRNGQSMFGAYHRPDPAVDVGTISITFADDSHGTITWPGGTVPIERQIFDTDESFEDQPKTGWWWNPAESGSGYSVEVQGSTLFVVAFMYDEAGNPLWYLTAGALSSPTHFEGDWLESSGGQTMGGPYRAPTSRNLGRVTIDFATIDQGTITFTEGEAVKRLKRASAPSSKAPPRSRRSSVGPQFNGLTWTDSQYWPHFFCTITQEFNAVTEAGTTGTFTKSESYRYSVYFDLAPSIAGQYRRYLVDVGRSYFDYAYHTSDTSNGCYQDAHRSRITPLSGELTITPYSYYGSVYDLVGSSVTGTQACPNQDVPPSFVRSVDVAVPMPRGNMVQRPNPFPTPLITPLPPAPYLRVVNSHAEPDGSSTMWGWDCTASP